MSLPSFVPRLFSFGVIGIAGFLTDSAVLTAGLKLGTGPYWGRLLSYLCAVTVTWALNQRFTFAERGGGPALPQWAKFAISQLSGGAVNLGVYGTLIRTSGLFASHPVMAVGVGAVCGMTINFLAAQRFVFNATKPASAPGVRCES
jgi:putative flippase GtrA